MIICCFRNKLFTYNLYCRPTCARLLIASPLIIAHNICNLNVIFDFHSNETICVSFFVSLAFIRFFDILKLISDIIFHSKQYCKYIFRIMCRHGWNIYYRRLQCRKDLNLNISDKVTKKSSDVVYSPYKALISFASSSASLYAHHPLCECKFGSHAISRRSNQIRRIVVHPRERIIIDISTNFVWINFNSIDFLI